MKPKAAPSQKRRAKSTETERPLDAEDVALSLLEAQVRAKEARADLGATAPDGAVAIRLPLAVISRLQAEAAKCHVTPSELIKRSLMQYLLM